MKISELFRQLSFGELSNLSISDSGSGEINVTKQPQLIHYTNDGLTALHARFLLREKDLLIEQAENITQYHLQVKYAESSGSDAPVHYIKDLLGEQFKGDLIRILAVFDAFGCQFAMNDTENCDSLFTPQPHILQIPNPVHGQEVSVVYQATHPKLSDQVDSDDNILEQDIELPIFLENALQLFIAHKVFSHMNGQENIIKGQEYISAYEAICLDIEQRDLVNQTFHTSHSKLEQRGFV